ncbi:MAG: glycosyl hydrolase [Opitutales bacterium]
MKADLDLTPADLLPALERFWTVSAEKIRRLEATYDDAQGSPVYTVRGRYTTRGWTEWTEGFRYGSALLQFDATADTAFLELGRRQTIERMASHLTHTGVHDHGFNNVSTYGNLRRLHREGRLNENEDALNLYEVALKCSGAVQASRWTTCETGGFIHSFNGPHSLFVDTVRSCRSLMLAHNLGHFLMGEGDRRISLLERAWQHLEATACYSVYYGEGRDIYDVPGRVAHESIFNVTDGAYRCPGTQQGYSGFSTWTRGLAWAVCGFPEQLEFVATLDDAELVPLGGRTHVEQILLKAAQATAAFYIDYTALDGIPYWDTGAPRLAELGTYTERTAEPFNHHEPVDASAAAIAAQGLLRLGRYLNERADGTGQPYFQAGLTVLHTLLDEPYLSLDVNHEGLLLHSVYHRPNGWDHIPDGHRVPCGESSMWGDYHLREAALLVQRLARNEPFLTFFS